MKAEKFFDIAIHSHPNIQEEAVRISDGHGRSWAIEERTYGFTVEIRDELPYWQRDLRSSAILGKDGNVYISGEIWAALMGRSQFWPDFKIGKRGYLRMSDEVINDMINRNAYERRSEPEREVQKRNYNLIEWLLNQISR